MVRRSRGRWRRPPGGPLLSLAAVIATAAIFGLTYFLSASLIALDLAERGGGKSVIGLNAAMHALGVLAIAPVPPRLVSWIASRRTTLGALGLAGFVLALFPALPRIWLWFPLRLMLGAVSEALSVYVKGPSKMYWHIHREEGPGEKM